METRAPSEGVLSFYRSTTSKMPSYCWCQHHLDGPWRRRHSRLKKLSHLEEVQVASGVPRGSTHLHSTTLEARLGSAHFIQVKTLWSDIGRKIWRCQFHLSEDTLRWHPEVSTHFQKECIHLAGSIMLKTSLYYSCQHNLDDSCCGRYFHLKIRHIWRVFMPQAKFQEGVLIYT